MSQFFWKQLTRRDLIVYYAHSFPACLFFRAHEVLAKEQSSSAISDEPSKCKNGGIVSGKLMNIIFTSHVSPHKFDLVVFLHGD